LYESIFRKEDHPTSTTDFASMPLARPLIFKSSTAMKPFRMPREPSAPDLMAAKKAFPPNYLHETWIDYLYWDTGLEQ